MTTSHVRPLKAIAGLVPAVPALLIATVLTLVFWPRPSSFDTQDVMSNLFSGALTLAFAAGMAAFFLVRVVLSKPFAPTLPSACTLMFRGMTTIGIVVSCGIALPALRAGGTAFAMMMFALSLLYFGLPAIGMWFFVRISTWPRLAATAAIVVVIVPLPMIAALEDDAIRGMVTAHQTGTALFALLCSIALIARGWWPVSHMRATTAVTHGWGIDANAGHLLQPSFQRLKGKRRDRAWAQSLARDRTIDWLLAGWYEVAGNLRWPTLLSMMVLVTYFTLFEISHGADYNINFSIFFLGVVLIAPFSLAAPLRGGFLYPIGRVQRAQIEMWSRLAVLAASCLLLALFLPLDIWMRARGSVLVTDRPLPTGVILPMLLRSAGILIGLAPLTQWAAVTLRGVGSLPRRMNASARVAEGLALYAPVGGAMAYVRWAPQVSAAREALLLATLALVSYAGYASALKRAWATSDLA